MPKHYTFTQAQSLTGRQLLADLGITSTGVHKTFIVNGGDRWTAWMTVGRGKHHGKAYVHVKTRMMIPTIEPDGSIGPDIEDVMHFRGPINARIGDLKIIR